jgi:hypothetical protein
MVSSDFIATHFNATAIGEQLASFFWDADPIHRRYTEQSNTRRLVYSMRTEIWRLGRKAAVVAKTLGGKVRNGGRNEQ